MWYNDLFGVDNKSSKSETSSDKKTLSSFQIICYHNWKKTTLIISTVYDCTKCGVKKEDYDAWEKERTKDFEF